MNFKEKMTSSKFWIATGIFAVVFLLVNNFLLLWWEYNFDFSRLKSNLPFSGSSALWVGFEFLKSFVIGFFVTLFAFQKKRIEIEGTFGSQETK